MDNQCTKTGQTVAEVLREKHTDMRVPPVENPACAVFENYGEVPETVPLELSEDDFTGHIKSLWHRGGAGSRGN